MHICNIGGEMKKIILGIVVVAALFLGACEEGKIKEEIKEEEFNLENIKFEPNTDLVLALFEGEGRNDKVIISTNTETLVFYLKDINFIKIRNDSNEISTVKVKKTTRDTEIITKVKIYLDSDDVKRISKQYADIYFNTLEFEDE